MDCAFLVKIGTTDILNRKLDVDGALLPSGFWLVADFGGSDSVEKLAMLPHVATRAKRYKIIERVIAQLAALRLVMDLKILEASTLLTPSAQVVVFHSIRQGPDNREKCRESILAKGRVWQSSPRLQRLFRSLPCNS